MIADLVSGKVELAEVLYLLAAVLFVVVAWQRWPDRKLAATLEPLGLALVAVALFVS